MRLSAITFSKCMTNCFYFIVCWVKNTINGAAFAGRTIVFMMGRRIAIRIVMCVGTVLTV